MCTGVVFSLFAGQLVTLQGTKAKEAAERAFVLRQQHETLPALRGSITDRAGTVVALSTERWNITADPTAVATLGRKKGVNDPAAYERAAEKIASVTAGDPAAMVAALRANAERKFVYLVKDVSPLEWQRVKGLGLPGIYAERTSRREYPVGEPLGNLVGLVGHQDLPAGGLETTLNKILTGTPGAVTYEVGGRGERIATGQRSEVPAVPGATVRLTIDADVQYYAYNAVRQAVAKHGALGGYAVVTDIKGKVLAAASYPSYDPREPEISELNSGVFVDVYEPGSTAKLITVAAAIEEGTVSPDTKVVVPPGMARAGARFKDSHPHGTLYETVTGVLGTSSNMGTMLIGETLPSATLERYMRAFGMGSTSGTKYPGESAGLLTPAEKWDGQQRYTVMYGQGMAVTAVQQIGAMQALANKGVRVPAQLVEGHTRPDGTFVPEPAPAETRAVSEETADQLIAMMESVVTKEGTAPQAAIPGYRVAGKTSTASRLDPRTGRYDGHTSSFVGLAPAENPQFVVLVVLQRPDSKMPFGGVVAGPAFKDIMTYLLTRYSVAPSTEPAPALPMTYDPDKAPVREVPGDLSTVVLRDRRGKKT